MATQHRRPDNLGNWKPVTIACGTDGPIVTWRNSMEIQVLYKNEVIWHGDAREARAFGYALIDVAEEEANGGYYKESPNANT